MVLRFGFLGGAIVSSDHPKVRLYGSLGGLFGGAIGSSLLLPVSRCGFPLNWQTRWVMIGGKGILRRGSIPATRRGVPDHSEFLLFRDVQ